MKKILWICIAFFMLVGAVWAQVPNGVVPAQGIPMLVPATFAPAIFGNGGYCQLTKSSDVSSHTITSATFTFPSNHQLISTTPTDYSHSIITTNGDDQKACKAYGTSTSGWTNFTNPSLYLKKFPLIPDWDDAVDGPLRVMRIGDDYSGNTGNSGSIYSSAATYYFTPNDTSNVLIIYFAFVAQAPSHDLASNPFFRIEVVRASNGQFVTPQNPMHSTFLVNPPQTEYSGIVQAGRPTHPYAHSLVDAAGINRQNCCRRSDNNTDPAVVWCDWIPVAFDLRDYIGETIRLRIWTADCTANYHWAYGYFTGKGINGELEVQACGSDNVQLSVPWGFKSYTWYINGNPVNDLDGQRDISRVRNTSETEFRCVLESYTGASFAFEATVNYYELDPKINYEQLTNDCSYKVQFNIDSSTVTKINNGGNEPQNVQYVEWDFGDGSPVSHELNPLHTYATAGPHTVSLTLWDNDNICDSMVTRVILLDTAAVQIHYSADTVSTCEENLPYIYAPAILPEDQHPHWNTPGNYTLTYPAASDNGCDSVAKVRFDVETPSVILSLEGDYCDNFSTTIKSRVNVDNVEYLWSNGEVSPDLIVNTPGKYEVTITDVNGCTAKSFIEIPACKPYVLLPNTISPTNADGINDCLFLKQGALIDEIEFYLFDRSGRQVFYTIDKNFQWCGRVNGKILSGAIYQYVLIVRDYNGIETMQKGHITTL